jgi:crotonobetainyl-CoA:carnitine CoA-transferase CaiB-like acyl-CoA transferase
MSMPQKSFEPGAACPLDGVRVIDMSRLVSGNMVSLQLADFGAEVLKIEDPKRGDPLRAWQTDGVSVHWKVYSRNKKSVALSLREARGRELLLGLIDTSQVLIENFRPGTLETMGLGPEVLHRRNPGLIIVRVSGWGQDGPYRDRPGFGTLVESMSGYASRTGFPDREPALPPTALADTWSPGFMARAAFSWRCVTARSTAARDRSSICRCSTRCSRSLRPRRRSTV